LSLSGRDTEEALPPHLVLRELLADNERFVAGYLPPSLSDEAEDIRRAVIERHAPSFTVLTCSDARINPNAIFLRGVGEMFAVRIAGNFAADAVMASIEFSVERLGTPLILILGHDDCGAVTAVFDAVARGEPVPAYLSAIDDALRPVIEPVVAAKGTIAEAAVANVKSVAERIAASDVIAPEIREQRVSVVGALYRLFSGKVDVVFQRP
jgi:carbonic anhydrase